MGTPLVVWPDRPHRFRRHAGSPPAAPQLAWHNDAVQTGPDGELFERTLMSDYRNTPLRNASVTQSGAEIDEGLRSYMLKVYNLMAMGQIGRAHV